VAQETVTIKGTKNGLVIILDPAGDLEELKIKLKEKISSASGFFRGAKFTLHSGRSMEETRQLEQICCEYGLVLNRDIKLPEKIDKLSRKKRLSEKKYSGLLPKERKEPCLLLTQNLRSGQKINYAGHVTILGDVNAGAQIVASGNIIVMGTLRGIAHAGANGDTTAIIVAHRLHSNQIRIGEIIARAPDQNKLQNYPEIAYLSDNRIVIEPYSTPLKTRKKAAL
jgi:septum site-determining protein MinC